MKKGFWNWLLAAGCFLLASCAVITVNVYFPEKAAKEAYKSLDEMLLKPNEKSPAGPKGAPAAPAPAAPQAKPQEGLLDKLPSFSFVSAAYASPDNEADELAVELSSMPEVLKAYDEMSSRLPRLTQLYNNGALGLSNQGLVTVRDKSKVNPQDQAMIDAENKSRKVVVTSMAKAILKLNKQKESSAALNQVLPKAAATFADNRRDRAQPGWWIQLENGRWVQK